MDREKRETLRALCARRAAASMAVTLMPGEVIALLDALDAEERAEAAENLTMNDAPNDIVAFAEARCAAMCEAEAARCAAAMLGAGAARRRGLRQQRSVATRLAAQMRQAACPAPASAFGPYVARMAANIDNDFMQMELVAMLRNLLAARELLGYELAEARGLCDPGVVEEKILAFTPPPRALAAAQRGLTEAQLDGVRGFQTMVALAALGRDLDVERLAVMIGCPWDEAEALLAPYAAASEVQDVP